MTFIWLPDASSALNSTLNCMLTPLGQNKCLILFCFKYHSYLKGTKLCKAVFARLDALNPSRETREL